MSKSKIKRQLKIRNAQAQTKKEKLHTYSCPRCCEDFELPQGIYSCKCTGVPQPLFSKGLYEGMQSFGYTFRESQNERLSLLRQLKVKPQNAVRR